ncbi:C-glycoside deglycosidase beta subunit domain-containing protein [Arthrobacter sp. D3-16]
MLETALREDALTTAQEGFELRIGLPWIRSMPLSSVAGLSVDVDGVPLAPRELAVMLGSRAVRPDALEAEPGWWFVQDRLVLAGLRELPRGPHAVTVDFRLMVPYLQARPGSPLVLPFHLEARLELDRVPVPTVSRDVA